MALLGDYNSRVVVLGTSLLGAAAGLVGSFTLLRKRALLGDALSHATLPGVGLAFLLAPRAPPPISIEQLCILFCSARLANVTLLAAETPILVSIV